jgi:hypothetical protein
MADLQAQRQLIPSPARWLVAVTRAVSQVLVSLMVHCQTNTGFRQERTLRRKHAPIGRAREAFGRSRRLGQTQEPQRARRCRFSRRAHQGYQTQSIQSGEARRGASA